MACECVLVSEYREFDLILSLFTNPVFKKNTIKYHKSVQLMYISSEVTAADKLFTENKYIGYLKKKLSLEIMLFHFLPKCSAPTRVYNIKTSLKCIHNRPKHLTCQPSQWNNMLMTFLEAFNINCMLPCFEQVLIKVTVLQGLRHNPHWALAWNY